MYWSLTSQIFLKASFLALLLSYASSSPLIIASELMDLASPLSIESRQELAPPPNFDSEIVTYTDDSGTEISFLHYSGVDIIVDSGVIFHLTPPLSSALRLEKNFCAVANLSTPLRKRATPEFGPDGSIIISDDDLIDLDIDECLRASVFFGVDRALQDGSFSLIPTTKQAKKLVAAVNNSFNNLVDDVAMYLEGRPGFQWVQQVQRRAAAAIAVANELGISIGDLAGGGGFTGDKVNMPGSDWYMSGNNTKLDCPDPKNWDKEHLICQATACSGDPSTYRCGSAQYLNCPCMPRAFVSPPELYNEDFINRQMVAFSKADKNGLSSIHPVCNGLGTPLFMPRDEAAAEVANFCSGGVSAQVEDLGHNAVSDRVLNFTSQRSRFNVYLTQDECTNMLFKIIDECDGNSPDNPNNLKHGGSISAFGWTLYLTPVKKQDPFCNRVFASTKWVERDVAIQATKDLCNTPGLLNGKSGSRFQNNANQGQSTAIYVSILFTKPSPMTFDDCMRFMSIPIDSCDGNDPVGNPTGGKFGGHFVADNGAVINVTPLVVPPAFPPSEKDINGNPQKAICGLRSDPKANHDTIDAAINQFCVTNNFLGVGSMKEEHGKNYAHVGGRELSPSEANSAYQDGSTACKHSGAWQGRIIADDCKYAMYQMRDKCFISGTGIDAWYTYRCVRWTMVVTSVA